MQSKKSGNINLKEEKELTLYSIDGEVIPITTFLKNHLDLLTDVERAFVETVEKQLFYFEEETFLIDLPLARTKKYFNGKKTVSALRGGIRSAYVKGTFLKLKGCRPEGITFPHWRVDNNFNLVIEQIPFGVLSKRAVIGEILGFLFMRQLGINPSSKPVSVFHYKPTGKDLGYALVQKLVNATGDNSRNDTRIESFVDYSGYTVHDLVRLTRKGLEGRETDLISMDKDLYIHTKVTLLMVFNFHGGFRGILNSNIGNDVVQNEKLSSLGDFDTFTLRKIPETHEEIRHFTIDAFLELIKTSLPFVDYIDGKGKSKAEMHTMLAAYYRKNSSLYGAYRKAFMHEIKKKDWDEAFVDRCIEEAFQTSLSFELLQELIPNSYTFKSYHYDSLYVPHN
ncbi:hypothetical protein HYW21_09215 [Candidatus Woesearchaeota archaeon]|nr:hypothetical protein [Candidatus Woesearchaeota archaeon]